MSSGALTKKSKFLSLVLRHRPAVAGIVLDHAGWVAVDDLLAGAAKAGTPISHDELTEIVHSNDKQRFALSADGLRIRANQGHSVEVALGYAPAEPPAWLFHGTATRFVSSIRSQGLLKRNRHHVHLTASAETARQVGQRYGVPVVLEVNAADMRVCGMAFYLSTNGVWLTEHVPASFIRFPDV